MIEAIALWCSINTGALIATKPHDLVEIMTTAEWVQHHPDPDAQFWKVIQKGDDLWSVALRAGDARNPPIRCPNVWSAETRG